MLGCEPVFRRARVWPRGPPDGHSYHQPVLRRAFEYAESIPRIILIDKQLTD